MNVRFINNRGDRYYILEYFDSEIIFESFIINKVVILFYNNDKVSTSLNIKCEDEFLKAYNG